MTATTKMVVVEVRPNLFALLFVGFVVVLSHAVSQYCLSYVSVAGLARARLGVEGCQCVWRGVSVCGGVTLQALVCNILPSTTAVFIYAIGSRIRRLSANEQFFVDVQTVVCWLQTTEIISDV